MQNGKIRTVYSTKKCNLKRVQYEKCNTEKLQQEMSIRQKSASECNLKQNEARCNIKKVQHGKRRKMKCIRDRKSATQKNCYPKRVQHKKLQY